jgi:hypothetical protein
MKARKMGEARFGSAGVPEPVTIAVLALGLGLLAGTRKRV